MKSPEKVIIINRGLPDFIAKQLVFFGSIVGVVGIGIWLESALLQYFGAAMWIIVMCVKAYRLGQNDPRSMTLDEAAAEIKKLQQIEQKRVETWKWQLSALQPADTSKIKDKKPPLPKR